MNINFQPKEIEELLDKLKPASAPGPDGIWPRLLREISKQMAYPLSIVFQKSLDATEVPSDWKSANVTPIFKKGSKTDPGNYRPVSLTSVLGKIMEVNSGICVHIVNISTIRCHF